MTEREALKLALGALKHTHPSALTSFYTIGDRDKAIKAIQEHLAQPEYQSTADKSKLEKVPAKGTLLAQPEQEPVKFEAVWDSGPTNKDYEDAMRLKRLQQLTTPPQRKPLTDEEIAELWLEILGSTPASGVHEDGLQPWRFARAIEAAHGIKGLV